MGGISFWCFSLCVCVCVWERGTQACVTVCLLENLHVCVFVSICALSDLWAWQKKMFWKGFTAAQLWISIGWGQLGRRMMHVMFLPRVMANRAPEIWNAQKSPVISKCQPHRSTLIQDETKMEHSPRKKKNASVSICPIFFPPFCSGANLNDQLLIDYNSHTCYSASLPLNPFHNWVDVSRYKRAKAWMLLKHTVKKNTVLIFYSCWMFDKYCKIHHLAKPERSTVQ